MTPPPLPTPPPGVGLNDLGQLTTRGLAAFAARTARRALPLLGLADDDATQTATDQLRTAVRLAEAFAAGIDPAGEVTEESVAAAYVAAETLVETAGYAGYAAAHAARVVRYAGLGEGQFLEVVASTFGTTRALLANSPQATGDLVLAALRADFEALLSLRLGRPGEEGASVDPSADGPLGPLWPAGIPVWFG